MNYKNAADMLYKFAEEQTPAKQPNLIAGGTTLGAVGGVWTGVKKNMKGDNSKLKNLTSSMKSKGFKGVSKQMIGRGAIGAGLGMIGGAGLNAVKDYGDSLKQASSYSALIEKYAGRPDFEQVKKDLYMTIASNTEARDNNSTHDLKEIDCLVCGYQGQPDYKGQCPSCGAIGGYPAPEILNEERQEPLYTGEPRDNLSVTEMNELENIQCYY